MSSTSNGKVVVTDVVWLWAQPNCSALCWLVCCERVLVTPWTVAYQVPLSMSILQERILEWVAISSCMGSFWPKDWTCIFCITCIGRQILYHWAIWEAHMVAGRKIQSFQELVQPFGTSQQMWHFLSRAQNEFSVSWVPFCLGCVFPFLLFSLYVTVFDIK